MCAWYPITPSSSLAEAFARYCQKYRVDADGRAKFAIIQAEDEIASIGMVTGAGWNGARAFTATSGPGISLMNEFIGLAYFAEIPVTIIDVQRGGPSTGMPTRTQQSDITLCAYASHGDTKHVLLLPEDPHECFAFSAQALDLADRLQTPVFVMTDLDIGMNQRLCAPFAWDDASAYDRGKVLTAEELDAGREFARYKDLDGDGIPYRTWPGTHPDKGAYFTEAPRATRRRSIPNAGRTTSTTWNACCGNGTPRSRWCRSRWSRNPTSRRSTARSISVPPARRWPKRWSRCARTASRWTRCACAFLFPESVREFIDAHETVFVVEQNRDGQMRSLLVNEFGIDPARLVAVLHYDGTPITARFIAGAIASSVRPQAQKEKVA